MVLASYRAPQGCPDEQAYVSAVEGRAQSLRFRSSDGDAEQGPIADQLRVRIQPDTGSAGWRGMLQIEGVHALEREVLGERCADVALALALIAVLRLDERAGETQTQTREVAAAPGGGARGGGGANEPNGTAGALPGAAPGGSDTSSALDGTEPPLLPDSAVQIVRSTRPRRAVPEATEDAAEGEGTPSERAAVGAAWHPSLAAHLGYASAPGQALQGRLRAELQLGPTLQSGSVALGFGYAGASDHNASADLDFALLSAQLDVCPFAIVGRAWWLRGCAALNGGMFSVSTTARDDDLVSQSSPRGWAALGPSLELGLPLASHWSLRLLAEASFLLVRDSFEVERIVGNEAGESRITRTPLYRPPLGAFGGALGIGYAF